MSVANLEEHGDDWQAAVFREGMLAGADTLAFPCADGTVYLILAYRR